MPAPHGPVTTRFYANYLSQPSRAILWAATIKKLPFELKKINPVGGEAETMEYLSLFPAGVIPGLEVLDSKTHKPTLHLTEAGAILPYLCETHKWEDLYPLGATPDAIETRAKIQQWIHWHHTALRPVATAHTFRPMMIKKMKAMGASTALYDNAVEDANAGGKKRIYTTEEKEAHKRQKEADLKKQWEDAMLTLTYGGLKTVTENGATHGFIATKDAPSIADLVLYSEIDQIYYGDLYDFKSWPAVWAWMQRMQQVPEHDSVRRTLYKFLGRDEKGNKK